MPTLFDHPETFARTHARKDGPDTSKRAAERLALRANTQCGKVLSILRRGPISNADLYAEATKINVLNPRARVSDLRSWGCIIEVDDEGVYRLMRDIRMEGE